MAALSIVSNRPAAGKTCLAGALARRHALAGRRVAYYKPFSTNPDNDPDLAFMQSALARWGSAQGPVPVPAPLPADTQQPDSHIPQPAAAEAQRAIAALEDEFDLVLVDWDTPAMSAGQPTLLLYGLDASEGHSSRPSRHSETGPANGGRSGGSDHKQCSAAPPVGGRKRAVILTSEGRDSPCWERYLRTGKCWP